MSFKGLEDINYEVVGDASSETVLVWAHGWGHDLSDFRPLAESLSKSYDSYLVDLPGFGKSPEPDDVWGIEDYSNIFDEFIKAKIQSKNVIWIGHSFGGSVGVSLAADHPNSVKGLVLIASAGLNSEKPLTSKLYLWAKVRTFKLSKKLWILFGGNIDDFYKKHGSQDYRNAGGMREILVRTINQDLSEKAKEINCPVRLLYGENDTATPPAVGKRYAELIKKSNLTILKDQDHLSILSSGRHFVVKQIKEFAESIK